MDESQEHFGLRPHLTKSQRLPKCYKEAEKILKDVKACKGNVKTLMNNSRLRGAAFKKVYALTMNVLKNRPLLDKIIEKTELLKKETFLREELAGILIYELVFGKGLPGESNPVTIVKKYTDDIYQAYKNIMKDGTLAIKGPVSLPRYARVNTLLTSVPDVVKNLKRSNYYEIYYREDLTENEYLDLVKNLEVGQFMIDYHFKDLLVFASDENLTTWPLYKKNYVYIQDKSSYIPVFALDPKPGSTVLDACAAPGMKTSHIAANMENKGKIYAYERDKNRFETLKSMLDSATVQICEAECEDFYLVNTNNPKFNSVEYILVDPSCSGSGMVNRMDAVTDTEDSKNALRLQKLAGFQILLLKHALTFPSVKRVVYSTCSISEEENEYVVHEVLNHFRHIFKLVSVMPDWPIRGSENYEFGKLCLRAYPEKTLTNGFFVAVFERMDYDEQLSIQNECSFSRQDKWSKKKKKRTHTPGDEDNYGELHKSCNNDNISFETFAQNENSNFSNDDSFANHHGLSKKRKKDKHEAHEMSHYKEISGEISNNVNLNINKNHLHKICSKTESKDLTKVDNYSVNSQHESVNCETKKKKHSYKSENNAFESASEMCLPENVDDCSINSLHQTESVNYETKKKKRKKNHSKSKSNDLESATEVCFPENESIITVGMESSKKRKKKNLIGNCDGVDSVTQIPQDLENSYMKKKNDSNLNDGESTAAFVVKSKKKKKHASSENMECCSENLIETGLNTVDISSKKKHKKKNKSKQD